MSPIDEAIAKTQDKIDFLNGLIKPDSKDQIVEQIQIQIIAYQDCLRTLEEAKNSSKKLYD